MTSLPRLVYASRMYLRPNPTMHLHTMLAKRITLHIDIFALVREQSADTVLFSIELRRGGRGEPIERDYWQAGIGSSDPPQRRDDRTARVYDVTDAVTFNALPAASYAWGVQYHHIHMLPLIERYRARPGFVHESVMFHYFRAYDLNPAARFNNFYTLNVAERYRRLNWSEGE